MPIEKPYRRTCRQFTNGRYKPANYIDHPDYASEPGYYVRSFLLLQQDLRNLFSFVEPADKNEACYSFRVQEMLFRACVEVEANCKAILQDNGYGNHRTDMRDYRKINTTHRLSSYEVIMPHWMGGNGIRTPFKGWAAGNQSLPWYQAYNTTKHSRHVNFSKATFKSLVDACCGVLVLLSAQFHTEDFNPAPGNLQLEGGGPPGTKTGIGDYFSVKFPDWPTAEQYDFNWENLKAQPSPFQAHDYLAIP